MRRRDGTGLIGMSGAMRGRGFGLRDNTCYHRVSRYGYGCRFGYESDKEYLLKQKEILENQLNAVEKELKEL